MRSVTLLSSSEISITSRGGGAVGGAVGASSSSPVRYICTGPVLDRATAGDSGLPGHGGFGAVSALHLEDVFRWGFLGLFRGGGRGVR